MKNNPVSASYIVIFFLSIALSESRQRRTGREKRNGREMGQYDHVPELIVSGPRELQVLVYLVPFFILAFVADDIHRSVGTTDTVCHLYRR